MAWIKRDDVISAFKESLSDNISGNMGNTTTIVATTIDVSKMAAERMTHIRALFNNTGPQEVADRGSVFRRIFSSIESGKRDVEGEEEIEFTSSGTKDDNTDGSDVSSEPKYSPDTISRNKTAYDIAGIQVKAVVAQTQVIVSSLSEHTTYLKNIDTNIQKVVESLNKGFDKQHEDTIKAAELSAMYNEKGYLNVREYLDQVKTETANLSAQIKGFGSALTDPKKLTRFVFDSIFQRSEITRFMNNIEESVSKGFTNMIENLGDTKLFRGNNLVSKTLRRIFMPNENGTDIQGQLDAGVGITESSAVAFDNITRKTITDVLPGLLERILEQNEIVAQVLQGSTGIRGRSSGITYDMKIGRFSTKTAILDEVSESYKELRKNNRIVGGGELDLSQWADAIEPLVFYMATTNYPIKNFWDMPYRQAKNFLLWGLGTTTIPEPIEQQFNLFWNAFRTPDGKMLTKHRKAIQEIYQLYNRMKKSIDAMNVSHMQDIHSGVRRSDQLSKFDGWYASEIVNGSIIDFENQANVNGFKSSGKAVHGVTKGMRAVADEFMTDMSDSVSQFRDDIRKLVHAGVEQQGSIYVHDSVAIEYLKALTTKLAPDADLSGVTAAESIHSSAHPGEKHLPSAKQLLNRSVDVDKSHTNENTLDWEPDMVRKGKYKAMSFAKSLGFHGYDDQLKSAKYDDLRTDQKTTGWTENLMYKSDMMRANTEIDYALNTGKISREQAEELRAQLNNSSPEEYKSSIAKTIGRWSPAVIGGLAFGPFGFLAGLGIKNYLSKSNANRVLDSTKRLAKNSSRNQKAQTKMEHDRQELEEEIQRAYNEGKLTTEERDDAMLQLSTMSPSEYKSGLSKWALRLGPAVAASLLGFGPLGVIAGAVVGKKLTTPSAVSMRKHLRKIKPTSVVWDDDKRDKLINDINKKIAELNDAKNQASDQNEKDDIDEKIAQLEKYKEDIRRAGFDKLLWYTTSIPGILSAIGNIRKLPGLAIRGVGKAFKAIKSATGDLIGSAFTKAKEMAERAYGKIFYGDIRITTAAGRSEMRQELKMKLDANEISQEEYDNAMISLEKSIEKYDSQKNVVGSISRGMRTFGRGVRNAAGILTGSTQKRMMANANRSVDEASKILYGDGSASVAVEVSNIDENVNRLADAALNGNSLNVSDSGVRELLVQILASINPNADLSRFKTIEQAHSRVSPATISSSASTTRSIGNKSVVNGKVIDNKRDDSNAAIIGALTAATGIDDPRDINLKNDFIKVATDATNDPKTQGEIRTLFNKTYRNLKRKKDDEESAMKEEGGGLFSKLFGNMRGFGSSPGFSAFKGAIPYFAGAMIGLKMFGNMNNSFTSPYNENIETRANVVATEMRNNPALAISGGTVLGGINADLRNGTSIYKDAAKSIGSTASNLWTKFTGSKFGSKVVSATKNIGSKASSLAGKFANSKIGKTLSNKATQIKSLMSKFLDSLKNNKFIQRIFDLFDKAKPGAKATSNKLLKRLFSSQTLKGLGKALVGVGIILDIYGNVVQQLENSGTNFSAEMDQALSSGSLMAKVANGFGCILNNFEEAVELGGDGFVEMLANSVVASGISWGIASVFPVYAIIKLGLTLLSIVLDMMAGDESNPSSITYFALRSFKYLVDDILALDDNLIQTVADTIVDIVGTVISLLTLNLKSIFASIKELLTDIKNLLGGTGKTIIYILCDLLMIMLITAPVLNIAVMGFIKLFKAGDAILSLRKEIELLLTGEITFGEFCGNILSNLGNPLKEALSSVGETLGAAKDWVVDKASKVGSWVKSGWNKLTGNGRGGRGYGYGFGGDLYQENPMYLHTGYNMYNAGCGPIALTAALRQQGINSDPLGTASLMGNYRDADGGTRPEGILSVGNRMGGSFSPGNTDAKSIVNNARNGKPVVMMGQSGAFGDGMHYMTAVGVDGSDLLVRDPLRPDIRRVHPNDIQGNVTSAIYGKGRRGMGGKSGRGFSDYASNLFSAANAFENSVGSLFGGFFGSSSSNENSSANSAASDSKSSSSTKSTYVDYTPKQATGDQKSINGKLTYPKEMCKDPGGSFPNPPQGGHSYGQMIRDVKDLLIAQYKYTLILPSVIACIMRGETGFGQNAHEKNLGNIMGHGFGTKNANNYITDAQLGHRHNYEAYNYWGESIYRIGHLLSSNSLYRAAVGNTDTFASLSAIGPVYAQNSSWATMLYNYWSSEHMKILKQYDQEAINGMQRSQTANGRGRGGKSGRGFSDFASNLFSAASSFENLVGSSLGMSSVDANTTPVGDDRNIVSSELNVMNSSGGQRMNEPATTAITKGSTAERVLQYLKQGDPGTYVSLGFQGTAAGLYTSSNRHTGIDFAAAGGTNIYSPVNGTIERVVANITAADGPNAGGQLGNNVQIKDSAGRVHWFAHMQPGSVGQFSKGDKIKAGDYIGKVGTTGRSTGNHLHYQVNHDGSNYYAVMDPNGVTGMGRNRMFGTNHIKNNVAANEVGMGGGDGIDYNSTLDKIYAVLLEIAKNTGASLDMFGNAAGFGRGNRPAYNGPDISSKVKAINRMSASQPKTVSNPIGIGYQKLVRGYA